MNPIEVLELVLARFDEGSLGLDPEVLESGRDYRIQDLIRNTIQDAGRPRTTGRDAVEPYWDGPETCPKCRSKEIVPGQIGLGDEPVWRCVGCGIIVCWRGAQP